MVWKTDKTLFRCEECDSEDIVELVKLNINTDEIIDSVDDSAACNDCGSTEFESVGWLYSQAEEE